MITSVRILVFKKEWDHFTTSADGREEDCFGAVGTVVEVEGGKKESGADVAGSGTTIRLQQRLPLGKGSD